MSDEERPPVTGDGPCPECGTWWSYTWTTPGWDGSLPATRVLTVADGIHRVHLCCPECGTRFYR